MASALIKGQAHDDTAGNLSEFVRRHGTQTVRGEGNVSSSLKRRRASAKWGTLRAGRAAKDKPRAKETE